MELLVALAFSVAAALRGKTNYSNANRRNEEATALLEEAQKQVDTAMAERDRAADQAQAAVSAMDARRQTLDASLLQGAVRIISRVRNVDVQALMVSEPMLRLTNTALVHLPDASVAPVHIVTSAGAALAAGGAASAVLYGATAQLAHASTEAPIYSLNGAARQKATLARIGGGTKAEGGGGEAAGRLVLGATAGAVGWWASSAIFDTNARLNLAKARAGAAEAAKAAEEIRVQASIYGVISRMAGMFTEHLTALAERASMVTADLERLLKDAGEDYRQYDVLQRQRYQQAYEFIGLLRKLLALPLVGSDGSPSPDASPSLLAAQRLLEIKVRR